MTFWRLQVALCLAVTLAACALSKPAPEATTYVIDSTTPSERDLVSSARLPETLRMGRIHTAAAFSGTALIYRMDDVKFVSDPYSAFIAEPAAMLGDQMAVWLNRAGPFQTVTGPESSQSVHYVLEADVTELYGDFRSGRSPEAVLAMRLTLIDLTGARPRAMLERSIAERVAIQNATPEALVRGYGVALTNLLTQLRSDLQEAVNGTPRVGNVGPSVH